MSRIRKALTFSNFVACLALFMALGGTVYAAGKISGTQIKSGSLPGNRIKSKTVTANQIKSQTLTANQIKRGSLTGAQIAPGSLTGTQINQSTLTGVTASKLASVQYVAVTISFHGGLSTGTATCPPGLNAIGGGATVNDENNAFVNDTGPTSARNGWVANGFGEPGRTMTVTAICTAAAAFSG
jgi:hypothetical protein